MVPLLLSFYQFLKLLTFSSSDISVIMYPGRLVLIFFLISCVNTVIPLQLATTYNNFFTSIWHLGSRMVNHKTRERTRRARAGTNLFIWMSHFSMTGVIKQTKLSSFFKKYSISISNILWIYYSKNCYRTKFS